MKKNVNIIALQLELKLFEKSLMKAFNIAIEHKDKLNLKIGDSILMTILEYAEKKLKEK